MSEALSDAEIERRAPVWSALSDLFLDTDVSLLDAHIVQALKESGYSAAEAERILREEVGPVFYTNLLDIAGEWAGWPEGWVRNEIIAHLAKPALERAAMEAASNAIVDKMVRCDFRRVARAVWSEAPC